MLKVEKIVGKVLTSNMYTIQEVSTTNYWIVDIGDTQELCRHLPKDANIKGLFLTHGHFDHIAGINEFHQKFPLSKIYTTPYGVEQLYSDKKNFSIYHEASTVFTGDKDCIVVLHDQDTISLGSQNNILNIVATPGHCPSCVTFYTKEFIFTGDSYIPGAQVVTKLPRGNRIMAEESLRKIDILCKNRVICAGHDIDKWVTLF